MYCSILKGDFNYIFSYLIDFRINSYAGKLDE